MAKPRKRKYKTLKGLFRTLKDQGCVGSTHFTLEDYLSLRIYLKSDYRSTEIELSDEASHEAALLFAKAIWSTPKAINKYADLIERYWGKHYGIFSRLWIEQGSDGELRGHYCAGQDWISETRTLQRILG